MITRAPRAILRMDAIQIQRPTADAGHTTVTYTQVFAGRGTLGTPAPTEYAYGNETDRVTVIDQTLALELGIDIRDADRVVTPRGTFTVTGVAQHRLHQRAQLRSVG